MTLTERVCKVALKTGESSKAIAELLGADHRAVASIMSKLRKADRLPPLPEDAHRARRAQTRPYSADEDQYLLTARKNGRTWESIAETMGRSISSVEGRCKLLCLELDPDELPPGMAGDSRAHVGAVLAPWPGRARFDGPRTHVMKAAPVARFTPAHVEASVGSAAAMCAL